MIILDGFSLTPEAVEAVARAGQRVELSPAAVERIQAAAELVDRFVQEGTKVYGVTTGVGELRTVFISPALSQTLQKNIIRSHAAGVGPHLPEDVVRAILVLRINSFCQGHSGVRLETVRTLVEFLNRGLHPAIPAQGSVGASGDLAPLSHMALPLIGEGHAYVHGQLLPGREALARVGLTPLDLAPKEGLALINGTQAMTGIGMLAWADGAHLAMWADAAASLTLEALQANRTAFDPRIHRLRPFPGQERSAANIRRLTEGSSRLQGPGSAKVQDAYSLRCVPQVHGAVWDMLDHVRSKLEIEANSVTDNPLLFPEDGIVLNGGNFHGEPIALAMDYLGIGVAELASISERRIERMVNPHLSSLPPFLIQSSGVNSGYMVAQYTAAALVSENKSLAHPASVDSIPTSANQEDHVSMGTIGARKAAAIAANTRHVLAIELACAAQAIDLSGGPAGLGEHTHRIYEMVRTVVPYMDQDRFTAGDIAAIRELISSPAAISQIASWLSPAYGEVSAEQRR